MEKYNLTQTGSEVQEILDGAAMQSDVTAEKERAELAEQALDLSLDAEQLAREQADQALQGNIDAEEIRAKASEKQNADDIDAIEAKIPAGASDENPLTTKEYVDDSIATASATFRGTYNLVSDLHLQVTATHADITNALATAIATADNNDYAFVQVPTSNDTPTEISKIERYKFNGSAWSYEYDLNNSGFTSDQWDAINSGITNGLVQKLLALPTNAALQTLLNGKQDALTFDSTPMKNSQNPVTSGGVYTGIHNEAEAREESDHTLEVAIQAILALIPSEATAANQLADKAFVNSSIATNTATFRGTFNLVSDLHLLVTATHGDIENALGNAISSVDNNDYCFVQIPTSNDTPTEIERIERYKYNGTVWLFEYELNNSGFTSAQWAAINSGITQQAITIINERISINEDDIAMLQAAYTALTQSDIIIVNGALPTSGQQLNKIYRQPDQNNNPPQYYRDYMWNGSAWVLMGQYDINIDSLVGYYECDTAGATAAKVVTASGYALPVTGGAMKIKMANRNTVANATLEINSTGAKPLFYNGQRAGVGNTWDTNEIVTVFYDGTNYQAYNVAGSNGDGVFDISTYNATGGTLATYADLEAALGVGGTNIPQSLRKGGMSVKFVQSSDNKYVQYRLMNTSFSTYTVDWQGVDKNPIRGSNNLIESGGVANVLYEEIIVAQINIQQTIKGYYGPLQNPSIGQNANFTSNNGYNLSVYPVESGKTYKISGNKRGPADYIYGSILFGTVLSGTAKVLALTNPSNIGESVELTYTPSENGYIFTWEFNSNVSNFVVYEVEVISVLDKLQGKVSDALKYKGVTLLDDATINEQKAIENLKFLRIYGNLTDLRLTTVYNDSTYPRRLILRGAGSGTAFTLDFPQDSNYKRIVTNDYIIEAYYNWDNHTSNVNLLYNTSHLQVVPFAFYPSINQIKSDLDAKNQEQDGEIADINSVLYTETPVTKISRQQTVNGYYNSGEIGSIVSFNSNNLYVVSVYPVQAGKIYNISGSKVGPANNSYGSILFGTALSASAKLLAATDPSNVGENVSINYEPEENGYIFTWEFNTGRINFSVYEIALISSFDVLRDEMKYYRGAVLLEDATNAEQKAIENLKFLRIYGNVDLSTFRIATIYNDAQFPRRIILKKIVDGNTVNFVILDFPQDSNYCYAISRLEPYVAVEAYYDWGNHIDNVNYASADGSHIKVTDFALLPGVKVIEDSLSEYIEEQLTYVSPPIKDKTIAIMGDSIMMLMRTNSVNNTVSYKGTDGNTYERNQLTLINGLLYLTSSLDNEQIVPTSIRCEVVNSDQSGLDSQNWPSLKTALGVQNLYNLGLGGAMFLDRGVCTAYPYNDGNGEAADLPNEVRWLLRKIDEDNWTAPDAIVIWLGTNGAGEPATDNYDAIMALDFEYLNSLDGYQYRHTFYGGLRWSLEMLYRNLPYCTILFASPVQTNPKDYRTYNALSKTAAAIKKMGHRYACQFIDALNEIGVVDFYERPSSTPYRGSDGDYYALSSLTEISGVYYVTSTLVDGQPVASSVTAVLIPARFLGDGLHPNAAGKKVWTNYLVSQLKAKFYSKQ